MRCRSVPIALALLMSPTLADDKAKPLDAFVVAGVKPKAADADAPMAEGWPKGTAPGIIEVKDYPAYRSAVARGKGASVGADNVLFYPLFIHITKSDVAMTTPVVSNYDDDALKGPKSTGDVSMEFVYRSPTQGQAGKGVGAVKVEDHPAASFACLGVQGEMDPEKLRKAVEALKGWLNDHKEEWTEAGQVRRIGYHAPMTARDERLWEVQIPVKAVPKPAPTRKP